jgi:hypothetical protein
MEVKQKCVCLRMSLSQQISTSKLFNIYAICSLVFTICWWQVKKITQGFAHILKNLNNLFYTLYIAFIHFKQEPGTVLETGLNWSCFVED